MNTHSNKQACRLLIGAILLLAGCTTSVPADYLSPVSVVSDREGQKLFIAESTAQRVAVLDVASGQVVKSIALSTPPCDMVLSPDGARVFVSGAAPAGRVYWIDTQRLDVAGYVNAGHTPSGLAISPDGGTLYVCNRFNNQVAIFDVARKSEVGKIDVPREPIAAVLSQDGKFLFVANHLPVGEATADYFGAVVSVIDTAARKVVADLQLPNGSTSLRGICLSPDGKFVYVTHILAHYQLPTTQLERGWMNTNALTIIDAAERKIVNTVLLDDVDLGAANPWGVTCSPDGKYLCVAHAGTHEISVTDRAALHDKLAKVAAGQKVSDVSLTAADVPSDLSFLVGLKRRLKLAGNGPRGLAVVGTKAYAAEYFTDSVGVIDIQPDVRPEAVSLSLGGSKNMSVARLGEMVFHDATHCFQKWQSCTSCHPDSRADALNWDLLNDGIGNPKNTKNMLFVMHTPPSMSLGVREGAEQAVRAGFKFIQFAVPEESDCIAVEEYLRKMKPVPSPYLVKNFFSDSALSKAAKRGKAVYDKAGCTSCHPGPMYTDLKAYDIGLGAGQDKDKEFDTPALREVWRTAPYLHDGRAATIKEVLTKWNLNDRHGSTSKLSEQELSDLIEFVMSL